MQLGLTCKAAASVRTLLRRVRPWPTLDQTHDNWDRCGSVLLSVLSYAVRQLLMIHADHFWSVQGNESALQKDNMLLLQWQRKPVDDAIKYCPSSQGKLLCVVAYTPAQNFQ